MKTLRFSALVIGLAVTSTFGMAPGVVSYPGVPQANLTSDSSKVAEQHFEKAVRFLKQENFQDAIPQYEKVIQLVPESQIAQDAQYWIGQAYLRMGRYDEALSAFNKLIEKNPGSAIVPVSRLMLTRVQQDKEDSERKKQIAAAADQNVIIDPRTGAKFTKVETFAGKDLVMVGGQLSPNEKFMLKGVRVVPMDGSEPFKLVDMPANRSIWSPDGKKVTYYSGNAIWFVPVNPETARASASPTKLLDTAFVWQTAVSWAPDSERIVFKRYDEKLLGIWILSLKDRKLRLVTDERGFNPRWSPDGKSIAYQRGNQIRLVPAEGGKPETLLDYSSPVRVIAWSPDGKWLRFEAIRGGTRLLRLADRYIVALDPPEGVGRFSSWSADGGKLLFFRSSYEYSVALRVVSSSGGPSVQLGRNLELWPYFHFWTRDSRNVITMGRDDAYRIIPLAGGEVVRVKMDVKVDGKPNPISLSPDRKSLLLSVVREDGKEDLFTVPVSLEEARTTGTAVAVMRGWERNRGRQEFAYSPDGTKLALTHAGNVWLAFPNGGKPVQLTKSSDSPTIPLFSSTGDFIAYVSEDEERNAKLKVVSSSGGDPTTLLDHCGRDAYAWSPDGRKLAAASKEVISVTSIPGGKPGSILDLRREGLEGVMDMCWLPDGKRIAFISQRESERGIRSRVYLVPASGGKVTELAADDDGWKDWLFPSPDGRWISYDSEESVITRPESSIWEVNLSDLLKETRDTALLGAAARILAWDLWCLSTPLHKYDDVCDGAGEASAHGLGTSLKYPQFRGKKLPYP